MSAPTPPPAPPAAPSNTPKKSRAWVWILLILFVLLILGGVGVGFIVWGFMQDDDGDLDIYTKGNTNYSINYNTDGWTTDGALLSDATLGYSVNLPSDWTYDSGDEWETGFSKDYAFIYYDDTYGKTTNHFVFRRDDYQDTSLTLADYSADFIDSLNEGLDSDDFKLLSTSNRTFGIGTYQGYVVILGDDESGERNYYVMTVKDGVAYELAVFYFIDQETQALADFEEVVATFELN